ncbi:MAG TPA: hypothetical protein VKD91_22090 [Pyrinomonadaceae bacterium]|nr:hypothetical protein [Pyrinomonadaceae bacterium]
MSIPDNFEKAFFVVREDDSGPLRRGARPSDAISVHFNPTSLQHVVSNTMKETGRGTNAKQYVSQSTAKLTMDLIFDTTDSGQDVRAMTSKVAQFMKPTRPVSSNNQDRKVPPVVLFAWGNFMFQGMVESFKETIDFFSGNGVPLRASVNLTMSQQDRVFEDPDTATTAITNASFQPDAIEVPTSANQNATSTASQGGDPSAGRSIAAANNLDTMRFTDGASLTLNPSAELKPAAAFSSGGGFGVSGGPGFSAGLGVSSPFGGSASAGVSASDGAFQGLRGSSAPQGSGLLNPNAFLRTNDSASIATDSGASFNVGGKAMIEGSPSLSADVGAKTDLRARIQFD